MRPSTTTSPWRLFAILTGACSSRFGSSGQTAPPTMPPISRLPKQSMRCSSPATDGSLMSPFVRRNQAKVEVITRSRRLPSEAWYLFDATPRELTS